MAQTREKSDNDDDKPTTNRTATSNDKHEQTYDKHEPAVDESWDRPAEEEEDKSGSGDKSSGHKTTDTHDDDTWIHSADTSATADTAATASSTTTMNIKSAAKKKARLTKYRQNAKMRKIRMKIKETVYKEISSDLNVSDSEAECTDEELQDIDLKQHRTKTLKRKYKSQAISKHNNEMKQHSIQQKGFTTKL